MINKSEKINKLQLQFQKFEIVKCGMYHEHVVFGLNKKPVYREDNKTLVFNREKLCNTEDRVVRLGCAQSSSNHNLCSTSCDLQYCFVFESCCTKIGILFNSLPFSNLINT